MKNAQSSRGTRRAVYLKIYIVFLFHILVKLSFEDLGKSNAMDAGSIIHG